MSIRDLNFECSELKSTFNIDFAQATTAALHTAWCDIKSVEISVQKGLSNMFSLVRAQNEKMEMEKKKKLRTDEAFQKYHSQGELRKSAHQTDLIEVRQIWYIVV